MECCANLCFVGYLRDGMCVGVFIVSSKRWVVAGVSFVAACALCAGVALSFAPPKASRPVEWEPSPVSDVSLSDRF